MGLELRYLRHFVAAVEKRGIGKAAKSLNISQPGLTRSIRLLEEYLQVQLFERAKGGVTPTIYGENLYNYARSIISEAERAQRAISEMRGTTESHLMIGTLPTQASFVLPEATTRFLRHNQEVSIKVIQKNRVEIIPSMLAGEFDLVFCILDEIDENYPIVQKHLFFDRPSIIVRANHPALKAKQCIMEELLNYGWVIPNPPAEQRIYINRLYAAVGLDYPNVAIECQATNYLRSLVMHSDFVGVLPTNLITVEERAGLIETVVIPGMENEIPFGVRFRSDQPLSHTARKFIREIDYVCRSMTSGLNGRVVFPSNRSSESDHAFDGQSVQRTV